MTLMEIEDVVPVPGWDEGLLGWYVDGPQPGSRTVAAAVDVWGWVLGRETPAVAVEVMHGGRVIRRTPLIVPRPDVAAAYLGISGAERSGFQLTIRMLGMSEVELELRAVLKDQRRVRMAVLRGRGCWPKDDAAETPLVSVVIPCYNQSTYLSEAIESVIGQSYPHLEIVVVDDGSTDNTGEVAARYPGVRCIRQDNGGLSAARNTGLRQSNGSYLVFLDADDRLLPAAVEAGLACFAAHPDAAFVSGSSQIVALDLTPLGRWDPPPHDEKNHYLQLLRRNYLPAPGAVLYRRAVFSSVGAFDSSVDACADYDLYLRVTRQFPVYCHGTDVVEYRRYGGSMSRKSTLMFTTALQVLRSQLPYIHGKREYVASFHEGVLDWKQRYGEVFIRQIYEQIQDRHWSLALQGLVVLVRLYPQGIISNVQRYRRHGLS